MATYQNKVTGVVVDTPCKIVGENWIRVTKNQQKKNDEQAQASVKGEENNQEPAEE